ncbi:agamous-like MADS-box protein AGL80 [Vicia villosa]|uniref:agamous-like MADS-box protein AGL80 n=1 Tax=Vicia villosa TaxID=3911 RepID=UPI00273C400F|nr:agamous-like MADS-box protein AGL80 [Vicia villosa]
MARKKVKLAFIMNDAARKTTYKKRKNSVLKKVDELSTLCGIEACAIIYSPYNSQPEIWPSSCGVQNVLSKFKTVSEFGQRHKMVNQETFLKQRVLKAKEQLNKQWRDNKEKEMAMHMFECLNAGKIVSGNMSKVDLNNLSWMIDMNLKDIGRRLDNNTNSQDEFEAALLPPQASASHNEDIEMNNVDIMVNNHGDEPILFDNDVNLENEFWNGIILKEDDWDIMEVVENIKVMICKIVVMARTIG